MVIRESESFMPGNTQAFTAAMNAADRYRWDGRWAEATREYLQALAEFPDDAGALTGLGFCYMQTRQWPQALERYEHVLQRDPSHVIALSKTAELYGILGRREDAYKGYLLLADLYSQAGQGARAEAAWQKAAQLSPSDPAPHERLAAYYFGKKDIALMIQERLLAAQGYMKRQDQAAVRRHCDEVLRADAANKEAQRLLSLLAGQALPDGSSMSAAADPAHSQAYTSGPMTALQAAGNNSGGTIGMMGNAGNFGGVGNPGPSYPMAGTMGGMEPAPRRRITASQVTGVLRQAQTFQSQGRFPDAIDLCEQILESGFDRPDARYFLGWLYQEQQRWDEAIRQFQALLNDPDYALSCYYALGQCFRAKGDLQSATMHFDEAVDRVNLDALTLEESDQLVQLCQEAADAHRLLGEQEQALTVYSALLGFLRSRGWNDKVAQVEFMLQQMQNAPVPVRPVTPPPVPPMPAATQVVSPEQMAMMHRASPAPQDAATMAFPVGGPAAQPSTPPASAQLPTAAPAPASGNSIAELPDWLTGILNDGDKTQISNKPAAPVPTQQAQVAEQPTTMQSAQAAPTAAPNWLSGEADPGNVTRIVAPEPPVQNIPAPEPVAQPVRKEESPVFTDPVGPRFIAEPDSSRPPAAQELSPILQVTPAKTTKGKGGKDSAEELLARMAGSNMKDEALKHVAEAVLTSTAALPENLRLQVAQSMQDIQKYINHGLLTQAMEECLHVIDIAPQYLDVHQVLCEIYVRQGKVEQAITKYAILVDTYIDSGRIDDAIATYRRILQLEPNNLTYRVRLINLLTTQGQKEDLLRERTLAAESYLRLGYMDRALTELEQALQESPTSVSTRLNYALALQKLGRAQQAVAEYQRVLQVDPRNITALVRWHVAMITGLNSNRASALEVLTRILWLLRGEGQRHYETVAREYTQATEVYPNNADVHFSLGEIHQYSGNFDKAIDSYQLAMRDSAVEVIALVSAAQCMLTQGRPEAAIPQLERALHAARRTTPVGVEPTVWAARPREDGEQHQAPEVEISLLLAKTYERTGKQEQMQAILRQVKQVTTSQDEVTSALAEISARQGDIEGALQEYSDLVRHYRNNQQIENALSVLNEMVRMAPKDPRAHNELAEVYVKRGMLDESIAELRLLSDIYQKSGKPEEAAGTIERIGNIYADGGDAEEALVNFRHAVEIDSSSLSLLRSVVGFCLQLGRTEEATQYQSLIARHYFETHQVKESVAALQQLITIDRHNYEAYDMLGQTYQTVGEYEQASRVYRNLAKVNPDNPIARERLATLQELRSR
jgi:tetratricopeptide (TPR) repeat protein